MATRRSPAPCLRGSRVGRAVSASTALIFALGSGGGPFGGLAHAADLPRVLVLPYASIHDALPREAGEKTAEVLRRELAGSEQLQLVRLDPRTLATRAAPDPTPARDDALTAEARERAARADEHIKKLRFRPAVEELEKVIALLGRQHPYIDLGLLIDAHLDLAVAHMRLGQDSEAEDLLAEVARLDPERTLDAERFPPVFIRIFDNVARRVKAAPRATLRVEPSIEGALVFLDGREVGRAPVEIPGVIRGRHYLRIQPPEGKPWADVIQVAAGASVRIAPDIGGGPLAELLAILSRDVLDEAALARALTLGRGARADYVVVGGVHREPEGMVVSSHLIQVATRRVTPLQQVVFDVEMLGAGIEIYKVGADLASRVEVFGQAVSLPTRVARDALSPTPAAPVTRAQDAPRAEPKPARTLVRRAEEGTAIAVAPKSDVRRITAHPDDPDREPVAPSELLEEPDPRSKAWLWILLGVAVLGGGAAGGYLYYDAANEPVTGSATMRW
jgi:tetratricopeptide (TPR) repeat protein